jgi:hypothetical protein
MTAIGQQDWPTVKALLHPYQHWTCADGSALRGRRHVLAYLAAAPPSDPPSRHELRDGQIYRWIE